MHDMGMILVHVPHTSVNTFWWCWNLAHAHYSNVGVPGIFTHCSVSVFRSKLQLRWRKLRIPWRRDWRSWTRRSPAPFVRSTSATPRSSLAFTTTARSASDKWPSEQGLTTPLRAPSAEGKQFYLEITPITCPRLFLSTE